MTGREPERQREIDQACEIIRNCAAAGIPAIKYNFNVLGVLRTPPLEAGLLAGITRGFVLELARELGIPAEEALLYDDDLFAADESFFTSTTKELVPIVKVDNRTIGTGVPGNLTKRLLVEYRRRAGAHTRLYA